MLTSLSTCLPISDLPTVALGVSYLAQVIVGILLDTHDGQYSSGTSKLVKVCYSDGGQQSCARSTWWVGDGLEMLVGGRGCGSAE